jgi:hypothetical protein
VEEEGTVFVIHGPQNTWNLQKWNAQKSPAVTEPMEVEELYQEVYLNKDEINSTFQEGKNA